MATTIGALRVELSANIAKFEAAMGKAAKHVARTQRSFERFGTRASAAGRSLSVGLTAPLVAVGALAAKSFLGFEQGMNKVAAVSGATEAEMAELTAIAKDLGAMGVFPLLKSLLPVVVAFLLPTTDTLDHRRVGNGTHRHGLFQEPMEELPAMA